METIEEQKQRLIKLRPFVIATYTFILSFWILGLILLINGNYIPLIIAAVYHILFYNQTIESINEYNKIVKGHR